jgi:hypothetical protein
LDGHLGHGGGTLDLAKLIYEQVKTLPEPLAREVLDFVAFLRFKDDRDGLGDLMRAQESALAEVWDNEADDVWNRVDAG